MYSVIPVGLCIICCIISTSESSPFGSRRTPTPGYLPLSYDPYWYSFQLHPRSSLRKRSLPSYAIDLPSVDRRALWSPDTILIYDPYTTASYKPQWRRGGGVSGFRGKRGGVRHRSSLGGGYGYSDVLGTPDLYGNSIGPVWRRDQYSYTVPEPKIVILNADDLGKKQKSR